MAEPAYELTKSEAHKVMNSGTGYSETGESLMWKAMAVFFLACASLAVALTEDVRKNGT